MGLIAFPARLTAPHRDRGDLMTRGKHRLPRSERVYGRAYTTDPRQARRISADRDEPEPVWPFTEEDPEQLILPGLPRGFLAYQRNSRYLGTAAGGAERARSDEGSAEGSLPHHPPS